MTELRIELPPELVEELAELVVAKVLERIGEPAPTFAIPDRRRGGAVPSMQAAAHQRPAL